MHRQNCTTQPGAEGRLFRRTVLGRPALASLCLSSCHGEQYQPLLDALINCCQGLHSGSGTSIVYITKPLQITCRQGKKTPSVGLDGRGTLTDGDNAQPKTSWLKELQGRFIYQYFNWRKDAWADVQLLLLLNASLVIVGGLARRVLVEGNMPAQVVDYWEDVYGVGVYTSWAVTRPLQHCKLPALLQHASDSSLLFVMRQVLAVWFGGDVSAHQWFLFQPMVFLSLLGIFTSTLLMQCRTFSSFRTLWREFPARSLQWQPPLWELRRLPSSSPLWSRYTASRGTIAYDILSHARHARLNDADSMKVMCLGTRRSCWTF